MQPITRKFFTNERSVPKQSKPTYQQATHPQNDLIHPFYPQYAVRKQLVKNNSDIDLRVPKEQYFKHLNQRRKNQGHMSNLKSELQNLKNEVNLLIRKQTALRTPQKQPKVAKQQKSDKKVNYVLKSMHQQFLDREDQLDDTASMSSVTTQKILNQPLRKLEKRTSSQNYDQSYYLQLENDLLKSQIKNLKNKYVSKKRELMEKSEILEKKNQYLEVSLQKSEQALHECRKDMETQIVMIKKQISLKFQPNNQIHLPENDKPTDSTSSNEMLQEKLQKLYDQIGQKTNLINNMSIEISDLQAILQKKRFQFRKQSEKNLQLSKQIELSKRESSRLQSTIEAELSKKKDIQKQNDNLKKRNKQLMEELYQKQQIVTGSQQYEKRLAQELQLYKKKQDEFQAKLLSLKEENKKLKQLLQINEHQIAMLKRVHDDTLSKTTQLTKRLKEEQQKVLEKEEHNRKFFEESKKKEDEFIKVIKDFHQKQILIKKSDGQVMQQHSQQAKKLLVEKQRQINRWKTQYKILRLKQEQNHSAEVVKKEQFQQYYRGYFDYKIKAELFDQRNKILESSVEEGLKKLGEMQRQSIRKQIQHGKQRQKINTQMQKLKNQIKSLEDETSLLRNQLNESFSKNQNQIKYSKDLLSKIQLFIHSELDKNLYQNQSEENDHTEDQNSVPTSPQRQIKDFTQYQKNETPKQQSEPERTLTKSKTQKVQFEQPTQSESLQLQQLSESISSIKKRLTQQDQKLAKNIRQLKNKDNQINMLKRQIRQLLETHEKQLSEIKNKYTADRAENLISSEIQTQKQVKQLCRRQIELYKQKNSEMIEQNVQMKRKIQQSEIQLQHLRKQIRNLSKLYNAKARQVQQFMQKNITQIQQRQLKLNEIQIIRQQRQSNLLNEIQHLKDQIATLRYDNKSLISINKKIDAGSFDEALKNQIETTKSLREQLAKENEEVFKVRDNYTLLRSQYDNLRSEGEIQKLKNLSERKNLQIQYQIQIQNLKNRLNVEQKKISSLQQKISLVIQQNKKKDSFIQSYIMGKKLPQGDKQFVTQFVKRYQIHLNGKSITEKLKEDSHELEKIAAQNYRLLKDMAEIKEKMLLYEAFESQIINSEDHFSPNKMESQVNSKDKFPDNAPKHEPIMNSPL